MSNEQQRQCHTEDNVYGERQRQSQTHPSFSGLVFIYLRKSLGKRCLRQLSRSVALQGICGFLIHSYMCSSTCAFGAPLCPSDGILLQLVRPLVVVVLAWPHFRRVSRAIRGSNGVKEQEATKYVRSEGQRV